MTTPVAEPPQRRDAAPEAVSAGGLRPNAVADKILNAAATSWLLVALIGQWLFAYYVMTYYGSFAMEGGLVGLKESHLPRAYTPGDTLGNLAIAAHLFLAVIILGGGPLQLVPQIRSHFPTFHRWNGRTFMLAVVVASVSGLYMIWIRGSAVGDVGQHVGLSLNAVLIVVFDAVALRHAIAREISIHRRWALRLFMAASGVWFARVGLWLWVYLTGGAGVDFATFTGPFLTFLNFGQYLLPLAVLELYLRTQDRAGVRGRFAMAAVLYVLTVAMGVGIYQAAVSVWLPRI